MHAARLLAFLLLARSAFGFVNGNFESGTTAGWTVSYGFGGGQSVTVVAAGPAPNTNGNLNMVYSGAYSCELDSGTGPLNHLSWASISQSDVISAGNTVLSFYYAAVLDGSHASTPSDDAYMTVVVTDNTSGLTIVNNNYAYGASPAPLVDDGVPSKKHLPWTQIGLNLAAYVGHTITVQFTAFDCAFGGHDSLAFVDGFEFVSPTPSPSITPTFSDSPTPTITLSSSPTPTFTPSFTVTPTSSPTPTFTQSFSFTYSPTITQTFTITQTYTITPTFTITPTAVNQAGTVRICGIYPNPFQDHVTLCVILKEDASLVLTAYNVAGEIVSTLQSQGSMGANSVEWKGENSSSGRAASGIYVLRLEATTRRGMRDVSWCRAVVAR